MEYIDNLYHKCKEYLVNVPKTHEQYFVVEELLDVNYRCDFPPERFKHYNLGKIYFKNIDANKVQFILVSLLWFPVFNLHEKINILNKILTYADDYDKINMVKDDFINFYYILTGMLSRFNEDDINYFIKYHYTERPSYILIKQDEMEEYFDHYFGWVLSIDSLDKLESLKKI